MTHDQRYTDIMQHLTADITAMNTEHADAINYITAIKTLRYYEGQLQILLDELKWEH